MCNVIAGAGPWTDLGGRTHLVPALQISFVCSRVQEKVQNVYIYCWTLCVNTHYLQRSYLTSVSLIKLHWQYKCVSCTMLNCWTALHPCTEIRVCEWSDFKHTLLTCKCSDQKRILAVTHESVSSCDLVFFGINVRFKPTPLRLHLQHSRNTSLSQNCLRVAFFFFRQDLLLTFLRPLHKYYRCTYNYVS